MSNTELKHPPLKWVRVSPRVGPSSLVLCAGVHLVGRVRYCMTVEKGKPAQYDCISVLPGLDRQILRRSDSEVTGMKVVEEITLRWFERAFQERPTLGVKS